MASSERSDFGSACTTVIVGVGVATVRRSITRAVSAALADVFDDTVGEPARAIAEVEFLAGPDPPDVGRVEALVAVHHGELTDRGQRVDVEERVGHNC